MQMQTLPFFNTPLKPYYLKPAVKDNPTPLVNTGTLSQNANAPVIQGEVRSGETDAYWRGFKNGGFLALISTFSLAMLYHLNKQTELKQALLRYEAEIRLNERQKVKENNNGLNTITKSNLDNAVLKTNESTEKNPNYFCCFSCCC